MLSCWSPEPRKTSKAFLMFFGPGTGELMLGRWSPEPPKTSKNDVFLMFFCRSSTEWTHKNHQSSINQSSITGRVRRNPRSVNNFPLPPRSRGPAEVEFPASSPFMGCFEWFATFLLLFYTYTQVHKFDISQKYMYHVKKR